MYEGVIGVILEVCENHTRSYLTSALRKGFCMMY